MVRGFPEPKHKEIPAQHQTRERNKSKRQIELIYKLED